MNAPNGYHKIAVQPLAGAMGAEISAIDLSQIHDDETWSEIRRAWLEYHAIFFRAQELTAQSMEAVARRFGDLTITPYVVPIAGSQYVHRMVRQADAPQGSRNYGDRWHVDQVVKTRPIGGIMLYALECPTWGGDTLFSNLHLAWDTLSEGMQAMCEKLVLLHSPAGAFSRKSLTNQRGSDNIVKISPDELREYLNRETAHPLVRLHPETARKLLYISGDFAVRFAGMTREESAPIIDYLNRHARRPEFTCRFRWSPRALALIDNRCCQHYAVNDYSGFRREMLRIELDDSDAPYGPAMPLAAETTA